MTVVKDVETAGKVCRLKKHLGFTFMEVIVVLTAIIAISAGAFIAGGDVLEAGRYNAAKSQVASIKMAIDHYKFDMSGYPMDLITLKGKVNSRGPWLSLNEDFIDPWGNEIFYASLGGGRMVIFSYGPNGVSDSDVTSLFIGGDDIGFVDRL